MIHVLLMTTMDHSHDVVPSKRKNDRIDEFISKYLIKKT